MVPDWLAGCFRAICHFRKRTPSKYPAFLQRIVSTSTKQAGIYHGKPIRCPTNSLPSQISMEARPQHKIWRLPFGSPKGEGLRFASDHQIRSRIPFLQVWLHSTLAVSQERSRVLNHPFVQGNHDGLCFLFRLLFTIQANSLELKYPTTFFLSAPLI